MGSEMCIRDRTYRAQFLRILRKDGYDKLIRKMKDKLAKDDD